MDANKKLEMLELEFGLTINHAAEVLEEYVNTLTEKILVDAFNELSVEDQMLVLLSMLCETQPKFEKGINKKLDDNKTVFDFDFALDHNLDDEMWEALQRLVERNQNYMKLYLVKYFAIVFLLSLTARLILDYKDNKSANVDSNQPDSTLTVKSDSTKNIAKYLDFQKKFVIFIIESNYERWMFIICNQSGSIGTSGMSYMVDIHNGLSDI